MRYRIEPLSQDNIERAADLVCDHIYDETGEPADFEAITKLLYSTHYGDGQVLLACNRIQPFGIIVGIWRPEERHYEVRNLYVDHPHRGGLAAHQLLRALLAWACKRDAGDDAPVYISTIGEPRPFYRALGFEPTHIISRASLKTLRERIGDNDGECNRADYRGRQWAGADEPGAERPAASGPV